MNRRSFLKVIGALSAAASMGATTKLVDASAPLSAGEVELALIRESAAYDLYQDLWHVRWDLLATDQQWSLDMMLYPDVLRDSAKMAEHRKVAHSMLEENLKHGGYTWADVRPLPKSGYPSVAEVIA